MARKSKKHTTYDSKETSTVVGLLSLLLSLFLFISLFSVTDSESNLFTQTKNLFGDSTVFTAFFLLCLGMHFLGSKWSFTKPRSLWSQLALVFIIPAFMTSLATGARELTRGEQGLGGQVGYFVVQRLMGETIPTQPATKVILFGLLLIFGPLALSMSLNELVTKIGSFLSWLVKFAESSSKHAVDVVDDLPERAATFGDFNKLKQANKKELLNRKPEKNLPLFEGKAEPKIIAKKEHSNLGVEVHEADLGDDGLNQDNLKYPGWKLPPLTLLLPFQKANNKEPAIEQNGKIIEQTLNSFGIGTRVIEYFIGPSVIQYALDLDLGTKVEKVIGLSANLALALGVDSKAVRIDSIPETTYLGIEIPRMTRELVRIKELMGSEEMQNSRMMLPVPIGKDINGRPVIADIQKMPHLLIAGATGSGKSVLTNNFINSLIMMKTPDELKLILVDPKQVEFMDYNGIAHLLTPVITEMDKVLNALKWAVSEMEQRYTILAKSQVRNIESYNEKKGFAAMPYLVIVIDEMADMMMTGNRVETETAIVRLAQKARAVGIHLILATQRPSVNVITGIIKANIPGRVAMSVTSSTDSRVIIDRMGAESLMGKGDLLYKAPDKTKSARLQCANIEGTEIIRVVDFIKSQAPEVEYVSEITEKQGGLGDEDVMGSLGSGSSQGSLIEQAIRIAAQYQKGSSSFLQRKLNIGFNKAAQLVEELEILGVVGPQNGSKPREVLISDAESFIQNLKNQG